MFYNSSSWIFRNFVFPPSNFSISQQTFNTATLVDCKSFKNNFDFSSEFIITRLGTPVEVQAPARDD
jgi:hypothetical protein